MIKILGSFKKHKRRDSLLLLVEGPGVGVDGGREGDGGAGSPDYHLIMMMMIMMMIMMIMMMMMITRARMTVSLVVRELRGVRTALLRSSVMASIVNTEAGTCGDSG